MKKETDLVIIITKRCNLIFDFIDTLFGEGKHKEIFGDEVNMRICYEVYLDIIKKNSASKDELSNMLDILPINND